MNKKTRSGIIILCLWLLSGCHLWTGKADQKVVVPKTGAATGAEIAGLTQRIGELAKVSATNDKLAQVASGAVWGAKDANAHNAEGLAKDATDIQLDEAGRALPPPTPDQKLDKAQQNVRVLAGELLQVKAEMSVKATEIDALKQQKAEGDAKNVALAAQMAELSAAGLKERTGAAAILQKAIKEKDDEISDLKDGWAHNTQLWAARALVSVGILIIVAGAAIVWISGLSAIGKAGGIALSGMMLVGSGLIVGNRYFIPVIGSAITVGLIAGCWYLWHLKQTHQIALGLMAAVQDVKDVANSGSSVDAAKTAAQALKENLLYRFPRAADGSASLLEKEIDRRLVTDGINAPVVKS